jgi:DnaK suppressor protein
MKLQRVPSKNEERRTKLMEKVQQLHGSVSKEEIAIERNAELIDEIQRTSEREIALTLMNHDWKTAAQVRAALQRLEDGTYGICESCEEPIGERRLDAIPWARLCIRCQSAADQSAAASQLEEAA